MSETKRQFPIQGYWHEWKHIHVPNKSIPWSIIAPHEKQALINHCGQNLEKLAQRGGLSPDEAVAVLEDRPWTRMTWDEAETALDKLTSTFTESDTSQSSVTCWSCKKPLTEKLDLDLAELPNRGEPMCGACRGQHCD